MRCVSGESKCESWEGASPASGMSVCECIVASAFEYFCVRPCVCADSVCVSVSTCRVAVHLCIRVRVCRPLGNTGKRPGAFLIWCARGWFKCQSSESAIPLLLGSRMIGSLPSGGVLSMSHTSCHRPSLAGALLACCHDIHVFLE